MTNTNPHITSAEWEVMRVVWANHSISSRQIIDLLTSILAWKEGTIKSLINRLVQKGLLIKEENKRPSSYQASISELEALASHVQLLFNQTCQRQRGQLLHTIIEQQELSQADCRLLIDQLNQKLDHAPERLACQCPVGQCHCHQHPNKEG
ncbi:CopY/TcrY family copper transport repressor [Vaginisenegalia massiliensis]|uniref:CopY/TcrY family copper transport repressor n=1 Tax=Vaginisenegalia massiliensis TaxID=2058294 RepID=UPI000F533E9D|nr:CopY/TcrY family copper transport repressor [Vaginisenegalia massiliensis]